MKDYNFRNENFRFSLRAIFFIFCLFCGFIFSVQAQSINQNYPTAVTTNEINGKIAARDVGDARLTSYFYTFNARQGDIFINVVTANLNGDIDVFTAENLRPLTKITVYADAGERETGRVIYLRQPEKLILRVEGRTPNDDAATFRIKFAGSFEPVLLSAVAETPETPIVKGENQTDIRVNSVGTIVEIKPKPTPEPKEIVAENETKDNKIEEKDKETEKPAVVEENESDAAKTNERKTNAAAKPVKTKPARKPKIVVTDTLGETDAKKVENENKTVAEDDAEENADRKNAGVETKNSKLKTETAKEKPKAPVKAVPPAELVNIKLVILFKDGSKIERPMSEVIKFSVDKGILTVVMKDGNIGRYSILDVEKTTIE